MKLKHQRWNLPFSGHRSAANPVRRGIALILVLVVVAMLTLGAFAFSQMMIAHDEAAMLSGRQIQARMLVDSGVEATRMFLAQDPILRWEMGGVYDNPLMFQAIPVADDLDPARRGNFTVIAPSLDDYGMLSGIRYGLENESARLNLNALMLAEQVYEGAGSDLLMGLPGMTEDIADAIMDWIDENEEPREFGAGYEYYSSLNPPYAPKNGPMDTVEELLLVRGVTPELLFGYDVNRNGMIDPHEQAMMAGTGLGGMADFPPRGWSSFLTLHSKERNVDSDGQPRININDDDLGQLHESVREVLGDEWANFIVAYRMHGPYEGDSDVETVPADSVEIQPPGGGRGGRGQGGGGGSQSRGGGGNRFFQVLDLIGARVRIDSDDSQQSSQRRSSGGRGSGGAESIDASEGEERGSEGEERQREEEDDPIVIHSPLGAELDEMQMDALPYVLDRLTVNSAETIPGRININEAPREILLGIPGMTDDVVDQIIQLREPQGMPDQPHRQHEIWIYLEGLVTLEEMRMVAPFITAGGDVFRAQIVGYFEGGGASARVEAIFDATQDRPRVVFWRDISHLGRGYDLLTLGITQ